MLEDVKIIDEGQLGVRVEAPNGPKPTLEIPGSLGGWKRDGGTWFTRVKGAAANDILQHVDPAFPYGEFGDDGAYQSY